MFIQESDLFKDLGDQTMAELAKIMVEESYNPGEEIYTRRDAAQNFYVLWDGRVRLSIGDEAEIDYTVSKRGEAFGWSGLVDRECYTSNAQCLVPSTVYKMDRQELARLFEKHPETGMLFYKRLAGAVVERLVCNYQAFLSEGCLKGVTSYGTGQVMGSAED
ncbi:MAG TPA: cyclic nucleotide-binding domain-containing protein [Desulfomonilaceae bacterium]|nr:cyclic nucleotide-binding domain-containing protein [Desulfomonilaceae bacterium]